MTRSIMFSCLSFLVLGLANTIFAQNSTSSSNSTTVSADATAACNTIDILLPGVVAFPIRDLIRFQTELQAYWSGADSDLVPACITFPLNATQTSTIVKVLNNYTDVAFAIKSGGHNTNPGWSSVEGGVLIAFSSNAATTISSDYTTADIGPGARWYEVMDSLLPYGKCVPGGRIGDVGVGGYLLGGGLSFLSAQYGMACDSVINYEVVLASSEIVNVNVTSYSDFFFALKGGGNQFGIITTYTVQTYDTGLIWGGTRTYAGSPTTASTIINATYDFITTNNDTKAAVIITTEKSALIDLFIVFFFYDGPTPPAGIFDQFDALIPLADLVVTQTYASLLDGLQSINARYLLRGITLPNLPLPAGTDLYNWQYDTWAAFAVEQSLITPDLTFTLAYQPMPVAIPRASLASVAGPNALGLDPRNGDHVWMEFSVIWADAASDSTAFAAAKNISAVVSNYAKTTYRGVAPTHYGGLGADDVDELGDFGLEFQEYDPIFMNDAMYDQKPLQSYPVDNYARLLEAKVRYDPHGFFTNRTGGYKF